MAAISQMTLSMDLSIENVCILIQISLKSVTKCPIDDKSSLIQMMAWCQSGNKPLTKLMLAQVVEACMHHFTSMS